MCRWRLRLDSTPSPVGALFSERQSRNTVGAQKSTFRNSLDGVVEVGMFCHLWGGVSPTCARAGSLVRWLSRPRRIRYSTVRSMRIACPRSMFTNLHPEKLRHARRNFGAGGCDGVRARMVDQYCLIACLSLVVP